MTKNSNPKGGEHKSNTHTMAARNRRLFFETAVLPRSEMGLSILVFFHGVTKCVTICEKSLQKAQ